MCVSFPRKAADFTNVICDVPLASLGNERWEGGESYKTTNGKERDEHRKSVSSP